MVRKRPVEGLVDDLDVERQVPEDLGHDVAAHPVGGVGDDAEVAQGGAVDERVHVAHPLGHEVDLLVRRRVAHGGLVVVGVGHRLDLDEAGVDADGLGSREAELDAVVLGGVVRGGEHRARRVKVARGVVEEVRGGETEVEDLDADMARAVGEGLAEAHPRGAHVARDDDPGRADERGERRSDRAGQLFVDLIGVGAPDVVGLEDVSCVHDQPLYLGRFGAS